MRATSRRTLFSAGAALLGAGAVMTAAAHAAPSGSGADPILEVYCRYRALNEEVVPVSNRACAIRAGLVDRHGEAKNARDAWERDPAYAELTRMLDKSDAICDQLVAATDTIVTTPATTLQGLILKLQVALDVWPKGDEEEFEYHDVAAGAVLRDAMRFLGNAQT